MNIAREYMLGLVGYGVMYGGGSPEHLLALLHPAPAPRPSPPLAAAAAPAREGPGHRALGVVTVILGALVPPAVLIVTSVRCRAHPPHRGGDR
jgi:hypothetical protein